MVTLEDSGYAQCYNLRVDGVHKYTIEKEQPLLDGKTILVFIAYKVGEPFKQILLYSGFVKEGAAWWAKMQDDPSLLLMEINL